MGKIKEPTDIYIRGTKIYKIPAKLVLPPDEESTGRRWGLYVDDSMVMDLEPKLLYFERTDTSANSVEYKYDTNADWDRSVGLYLIYVAEDDIMFPSKELELLYG